MPNTIQLQPKQAIPTNGKQSVYDYISYHCQQNLPQANFFHYIWFEMVESDTQSTYIHVQV